MPAEPAKIPKVSVCLPNLNNRPFLPARMASILAQTFQDWELVVCDSFSDDGAWEYFQQFKADPRVRLFQVPREGIYAGWNECLRRARGEFIYIATSDDTMVPDCLEKMVAALEAHPGCGLCHCGLSVIDENGDISAAAKPWPAYDGVAFFGGLIGRRHVRPAPHDGLLAIMVESVYLSITQLLIRRSLFESTGLFPKDCGSFGDYAWQIRAGLLADTVHVPETLATWRVHAGQASQFDKYLAAHAGGKILEMVREAMAGAIAKKPGLEKILADPQLALPLRLAAINARLKSAHGGRQALAAWARSFVRDPGAAIHHLLAPSTGEGKIAFARNFLGRHGLGLAAN